MRYHPYDILSEMSPTNIIHWMCHPFKSYNKHLTPTILTKLATMNWNILTVIPVIEDVKPKKNVIRMRAIIIHSYRISTMTKTYIENAMHTGYSTLSALQHIKCSILCQCPIVEDHFILVKMLFLLVYPIDNIKPL